ncbi:hypothetical protein [Cohnella sp.]|uniref:hypothetical protein n=1 Tax=Cohnella sp. TaxID=1883426 RepID=UPI003568BE7C
MKRNNSNNVKEWKKGKIKIKVKQKATAFVFQGGNAIAINASDIGVVRNRR